ncbi:arylalkylamine N-acetyltransferase-like 2 [Watersipora subatra]|uniref:arylalkylamine N-acetyltransferase-like 2 n=1 Tax=Watersipora subatra TaxID=2589382 RepID=UPI00355ADE23
MIDIQIWDEERKTRWRELLPLWHSFWDGEPISSGVWSTAEDYTQGRTNLVYDRVVNGTLPIVVAYDTEKAKVAGFLWSCFIYSEDKKKKGSEKSNNGSFKFETYGFPKETLTRLTALREFMDKLTTMADVFNKFSVDEAWGLHTLSVSPDYGKKGIGTQLLAKGLELAKESGVTLVTAEATNRNSLHMLKKYFNFETVLELSYAEHYGNYCYIPDDVKQLQPSASALVKRMIVARM